MDAFGLSDLPFLPSLVTRAEIPEDISSVQTIDSKAEVRCLDVGLEPDVAENIWAAALRWYRSGIHPAISMCIRVRGEVILRRSVGYSHGGGPTDPHGTPKVKVTPETPFNLFSASKPMPAMAIHLLDQRHLLHLDDPVCEYIGEFCDHSKEWVTIRHVLTHRAGIPVIPDAALDLSYLEDIDNKEAIRLLCEARPVSRAGSRLAYHAVTGGFLMGEIVRRVTGKNIRQFVDEEFCKPFGWRWMNFGVKKRDVPKVASSYFTGLPLLPPFNLLAQRVLGIDFVEAVELSNDPRYLMGVLPAANLIATADELSQFYQMLLQGGELNGRRVFDNRTVWRATSEQSYGELDFTLGVPLRYGMGFMLGGEWLSLYGFDSQHAFGHLGLTNIVGWADPQRHLSVGIMTSGKPVVYPEMHRGLQLVYTIASSCPKDPEVSPRLRDEPRARGKAKAGKSKRTGGTAKKRGTAKAGKSMRAGGAATKRGAAEAGKSKRAGAAATKRGAAKAGESARSGGAAKKREKKVARERPAEAKSAAPKKTAKKRRRAKK